MARSRRLNMCHQHVTFMCESIPPVAFLFNIAGGSELFNFRFPPPFSIPFLLKKGPKGPYFFQSMAILQIPPTIANKKLKDDFFKPTCRKVYTAREKPTGGGFVRKSILCGIHIRRTKEWQRQFTPRSGWMKWKIWFPPTLIMTYSVTNILLLFGLSETHNYHESLKYTVFCKNQ